MNPSYEHLRESLLRPRDAAVLQARFDKKRFNDVVRAKQSRPHFLYVSHDLPAAISGSPIQSFTEELNHDVILHGAITDGESRNIRFLNGREPVSLVNYGREANLKLSLDAIAGHSVASAGYAGVSRFPEPFLLRASEILNVECYQETAVADLVSTVFCGERIYPANAAEAMLTESEKRTIEQFIKKRPAPETRYGLFPVVFDADGNATGETPKVNEPRLILGFRSTFTDALVNLGFDSDNAFSKQKFPLWALAAEPNNARGVFQMLKSPLYVGTNQQLLFSFKNQINDVAPGPFATNGNIEVLMRTV